jgi:hypothetical protein
VQRYKALLLKKTLEARKGVREVRDATASDLEQPAPARPPLHRCAPLDCSLSAARMPGTAPSRPAMRCCVGIRHAGPGAQMLSVGFGLRDSVHSRVHHYKQPGELAYFLPPALRAALRLRARAARPLRVSKPSDGLARSRLLRAGDGAVPLKHRRNAARRSVAASQHATNRRCGSRVATRRPRSLAAPLARGGRRIVGARAHCRYPALAASWALSRALVVRVARNVTVEKGFEPYPGTGTTLKALAS